MNSIRKWLYKPKKTDQSLLAQFFYADEDLNGVTSELDSFDGRKDPDRCTALVNHLRQCQDKVLNICQMLMDEVIPEDRAPRDFRAKFPDDVLQENLAGQLWFGAECLAAGSSILNRELESTTMRPLAKAFTKSLENVRNLLREQCFRNPPEFTEKICESLKILDRLFAEFELSYVSAMVPVKTIHEYEAQQAITVLFSETLQRALTLGLLCQDQVDSCDPAVMFTIPRLAIVAGLLIFPEGPLCLDHGELSEMFRPFRSLLLKIRELLWTLTRPELSALERALCSSEEPDPDSAELADDHLKGHHEDSTHPHHQHYYPPPPSESTTTPNEIYGVIESRPAIRNNAGTHSIQDYLDQFCKDFPQCKEFISDLCHNSASTANNSSGGTVPNNNEMTVSQYSMNLSQSTGAGEVADRPNTRHQLHPNSVTTVNHSNNCYIQEGTTTTEGNTGPMANQTCCSGGPEGSCESEERESVAQEEVAHDDLCPPGLAMMSHSYSCYEELPGSTLDGEGSPPCLLSPDEVVPMSHASSSSSHDSGLCSMTDKDSFKDPPPTADDSGPSSDYPTITTTTTAVQSSSHPPPSYHSPNCSCINNNNTNSNRGSISKSTLLQIPDSAGEERHDHHHHHHHHHRTHLRLPSSSQEVRTCTGNCSRTSPGDESACDTSSFDSECQDDIEIALALQAAEIATRTEARSRFKNSADLIHRLFICISGVADQLQTNYAADLRSTLKCVFAMNAIPGEDDCDEGASSSTQQDTTPEPSLDEEIHDSEMSEHHHHHHYHHHHHVESSQSTEVMSPPSWVPDELAPQCMACLATFTVVRRRHHCRACGKVFCGKCSGNSVPLPRYGYGMKPQRVCNTCFVYRVTPFTLPTGTPAESLNN